MTEPIRYSAPGKLFLFGEYAVLGGAWSVVTAVDRRVVVTRGQVEEGYHVDGAASDSALPEAVLGAAASPWSTDYFRADVRAMYEGERKLGLGSSAASAVALAAASLETMLADHVFDVAFRGHRNFQAGRGSGADVAASAFGGTIAYRLKRPVPPFGRSPLQGRQDAVPPSARSDGFQPSDRPRHFATEDAEILCLPWPDDLVVGCVWTGEPADSRELMGRVEPSVEAGSADEVLAEMAEVGQGAVQAFLDRDATGIVHLADRYDRLLERLGEASGAPIVTDLHRKLRQASSEVGGIAKASGAGGGDFSLVLGVRGAFDLRALRVPDGCRLLELTLHAPGVSDNGS